MKTIIALAVAVIASFATIDHSEAAPSYGSKRFSRNHSQAHSCAPVYVCTRELCRRTECRWANDHCGRRYSFEVVVITYADFYSDGSRRTYTRSYQA